MHPKDQVQLTVEELSEVDASILKGVVSRAYALSFVFAIVFAIYSFTSLEFLRIFKPELSAIDNAWPRILLNSLPMAVMGYLFKTYNKGFQSKAWLWTFGMPIVFSLACCIHVWPLIYAGKYEVYLFVHAANAFTIALSLLVVAPPPKLMIVQIASFVILLIAPVCFLLSRSPNDHILKLAVGDFLILIPATAFATHMTYQLRRKIAIFDRQMRKLASPFLGTAISQAIYNQRSDLLQSRKTHGLILLMDIRGYTDFYKSSDTIVARQFMSDYHSMVSRIIGKHGGYWHKSIGDAQLSSFGIMDSDVDLSDIPGIESELKSAEEKRDAGRFQNLLKAVFSISYEFERLKEKYDVEDKISLGIAAASGEVEIRVQGDDTHKKELDIDGRVIIRCARLEAYSKIIRKKMSPDSSVLILSPELSIYADGDRTFSRWEITSDDLRIPNFEEIDRVYFHVFRDVNERRERIIKLRAS